jgi:hypothetical protein
VDVPLPWERLLWSGRSLWPRGARYVLTDFRLVHIDGDRADEILLQDIGRVDRHESRPGRRLGVSTVSIHPLERRRRPIVLRHIRKGTQLAALLELAAGHVSMPLDADGIRAALQWEPPRELRLAPLFVPLVVGLVAAIAVGVGIRGRAASATYSPDDAIYPNGEKRDNASIVRFMETEVMPWARSVIGPLKGGPERISCDTCHGVTHDERRWRMPAVAALPEPEVAIRGWEMYSERMDAQTRNAIYGYAAESDNQSKAAYMREVVMPGMAALLHRPAYDFTKPYAYNRARLAFGCYHCHQVK